MGDNDHSKQTILRIINTNKRFTQEGRLFIAEVKRHIQENYLNDFINFPHILRNYEFTTDERTIGSYMFNHMKDNTIKTDQKQRNDGIKTEKCRNVKMMNRKQTERAIRSNAFMDEQKISEDNYIVQMNLEHCRQKTPLQVAFFVLDNVKYWYLHFIYNFMYKCLAMNRKHFIEGDSDSAHWAIGGNLNKDFIQQFNAAINNKVAAEGSDRDFYNESAKYFFPTIKGDVYDEKKILGLAIERQGTAMVALASKNYMIDTNYCANLKIKLKGVNQKTNKITKEQIVDCINESKITKCTNVRLGQKNHQMSYLSIEKN
ncbi:MAG: hypothetical protein EZS28_019645 [Streblomastix strix]|uniref:Uncharacterized protein n=1 Tax=Streblomastix strix TaxID=222440 RepID=A0A5J4VQA2_9EUKA|nr:MAG: hypothetical protein EZS28_019645 [Streblomastix strix]